MRLWELIGESWRAMHASRVPSTIVAVLCAAMCAAAILTVGRSAAADEQLQNRLEEAGARLIHITSSDPTVLPPSLIGYIQSLNTVSQSVGVSRTLDVFNSAIGLSTPNPATMFIGEFHDIAQLTSGRVPEPHEAVVTRAGLERMGFDAPVGALQDSSGTSYPVVGTFEPRPPFGDLGVALIPSDPNTTLALTGVKVVTTTATDALITQDLVLSAIDSPNPGSITVVSPASLASLRADLRTDFGDYSRSLFLMILIGGGLLLGVVVFADTLLHRKDFGRRRALGVTRIDLTLLVTLRAAWAALFGVALGSIGAWAYATSKDVAPPSLFVLGVGVLVLLFCLAFSALPAALAAFRDPVSVLRTA